MVNVELTVLTAPPRDSQQKARASLEPKNLLLLVQMAAGLPEKVQPQDTRALGCRNPDFVTHSKACDLDLHGLLPSHWPQLPGHYVQLHSGSKRCC
ncbi:UNVERIFIED_CONTAM: hypothetical protein FKN15_009509 [Acipenser sinensis]